MLWNKKSLRMQERELEEEEAEWHKEKRILERTNKLKEEKRSFKKKKKITTTKLLVAFLFINCTLIELFTAWITAKSLQVSYMTGNPMDFSPLVTLILPRVVASAKPANAPINLDSPLTLTLTRSTL